MRGDQCRKLVSRLMLQTKASLITGPEKRLSQIEVVGQAQASDTMRYGLHVITHIMLRITTRSENGTKIQNRAEEVGL